MINVFKYLNKGSQNPKEQEQIRVFKNILKYVNDYLEQIETDKQFTYETHLIINGTN